MEYQCSQYSLSALNPGATKQSEKQSECEGKIPCHHFSNLALNPMATKQSEKQSECVEGIIEYIITTRNLHVPHHTIPGLSSSKSITMLPRPDLNLCPEYTHYYINLLEHDTLDIALNSTGETVQDYFGEVPAEKETLAYAPGKWTPRELLGHLIDVERILAYRALRFSRQDNAPLAGFDEDLYINNGNYNDRPLGDLIHEFTVVRVSSLILFNSLPIKGIDFRAEANHVLYSPLSLGWMIAGHTLHHCRVLRERYA